MTENKVKKSTLLGWGVGDFGFQMMIMVSTTYFAAFLTDYASFSVVLSGLILSVVGIGDAVTQPFSGVVVTKVNMKWGKYRSWYLVGPPIVALFFILGYTKIGTDAVAAGIIIVTYVLARFTFNCVWAAHLALIPYISKNPADRSFLSASRGMYQAIAGIIFSAVSLTILLKFVDIFGDVSGVTVTAAFFSLFMIAGYLVSYRSTKDVADPQVVESSVKEKVRFMDFVNSIISNKPLMILILAETCRSIGYFMFLIFIFYYWKYTTSTFTMFALFMTILNGVKFVGAAITAWVAGKIGAKLTYLIGEIGCGISFIIAWMFAANTLLFTIFCLLAFIFVALPTGISSLMFTHVGIYSQWKTGKDNRAFITGLIGLPFKIASFAKGALMAAALTAMGYVANATVTESVVSGIYKQVAFMPAIWAFLSAGLILLYGLNNSKVKEMSEAMDGIN